MNIFVHNVIHSLTFLLFLFHSNCYPYVHQGFGNTPAVEIGDQDVSNGLLFTCSRVPQSRIQVDPEPNFPPLTPEPIGETLPIKGEIQGVGVLPDSLKAPTYSLGEVIITATRLPQTASYTPSSITILSKRDIQSMNGTSLAELISPAVGIFIKEYGAASGLKTISQRGLGAEHTLILLNGLRISNAQNGLTDLGLVPVDGIESVEIVRGGQSASFGADAVGGIVNVVTRPEREHTSVRATSSLGSFGYRRYHVSGTVSSGLDAIRLSYGEEKSDEDFPFEFQNGIQKWNLSRRNADLTARFADLHAGIGFGEQSRLSAFASTYTSERGVPGAVVSPGSFSGARQTDKNYIVQSSLSIGLAKNLTLGLASQIHLAYERYQDPNLSIAGRGVDSYFKNNDLRIEPRLDITLREGLRLGLGSELVQISGEGNSLTHEVKQTQFGMFFAGEVAIMRTVGVIADLSLFPIVRLDAISSMLPTWSPQIGLLVGFREINIGVFKAVKPAFRSSLSRNFRMPTFNELYFIGGGGLGNSSLRPEKSLSFDVGSSVQFILAGEHLAQTTYFVNDMSDRIVWVGVGNGTVSPKNLRRVRSRGLESSYRWDLPDRFLSLQVAYSTSSSRKVSADFLGDPTAEKQLVYVPQETLTLSATGTLWLDAAIVKEVGGSLGYSLTGYRYLTEDNTEFLPAHKLVNIGIRSRLALGQLNLSAKLEINNLLNEEYQVMLGYPMPLRSYRATFSLEY